VSKKSGCEIVLPDDGTADQLTVGGNFAAVIRKR
jgi:hypothetical protein